MAGLAVLAQRDVTRDGIYGAEITAHTLRVGHLVGFGLLLLRRFVNGA